MKTLRFKNKLGNVLQANPKLVEMLRMINAYGIPCIVIIGSALVPFSAIVLKMNQQPRVMVAFALTLLALDYAIFFSWKKWWGYPIERFLKRFARSD